ncbi:hypothetical protein BKA67DRAFT_61371 [Truncatella angustata]|uniref:Paramyosin n=1 Tax=Truncatella angustata TaxID=152316 RepID=A0A9P8UY32_9PEZI|nr:uncharacterized protein BKA67DRAFT_61371 [Truncatella angustata]KAH6660656.1 hypothetical protein BKA67DRAFT_61371 [Truncatella angustata]KAH8199304.1 hypothetical protein TruAng_006540 [Truncatella angustata]
MAASSRPRVEVPAAMAGGFPSQYELQDYRSGQQSGMTSETETTSSRSSDRPAPNKGILKPVNTRTAHDPLAARFYRVGRPEQIQHSPTYPPVQYGHDNSWHHDSYDSYPESAYDPETDSQSGISDLSINTQATSVASDETITDDGRPSTQIKHVRHVPPPTVARVKARPRTRPSSTEVAKSPPQKRQVNIQIFPPGASSQSQELQVSRKAERDLLDKIDELELEAESLRDARVQLNKELVDATDKLSARVYDTKDLQKSLSHERNAKELLARELQEQRTKLDEYRSNFNLQKGMLEDAEKERDGLKDARDALDRKVGQLERDMTTKEAQHKELEVILVRKAAELERSSKSLSNTISSQDKQLKALEAERESLKKNVDGQDKQLQELKSLTQERDAEIKDITKERDTLKSDIVKQNISYVDEIKILTSERDSLTKELEGQQEQMKEHKDLTAQRDSLKTEVEKLQEQVKTLTDEQTTLRDEKKGLEEGQEKLEGHVKEVEEENGSLHTEIDNLKEEIQGLKGDIEAFKTQIDKLEESREELEEEVRATKDKAAELLEAEKQNGQKLVEAEKSKLEAAEKQAESDKAELQITVAGLKTELEGAKDANVVIVSERLQIKNKLDGVSASLTTAQGEVKDLQDRNTALESDIASTKATITDLESKAEELNKLAQQHKELEERTNNLQADIDKRTEGDAILQAEREQLKADKEELDALKEKLEDASAVTKLTEEKETLEARTKDLEAQADALKAEETKLKAEIESLKAEADKVPALTQQHQAISTQLSALTQQLEQARAVSDAAAGQVRDLQAQVNKLQSRPKSRSGSRSKKHDRSRSQGLVFVRNPFDKGAGLFVTTREALKAGDQG